MPNIWFKLNLFKQVIYKIIFFLIKIFPIIWVKRSNAKNIFLKI